MVGSSILEWLLKLDIYAISSLSCKQEVVLEFFKYDCSTIFEVSIFDK